MDQLHIKFIFWPFYTNKYFTFHFLCLGIWRYRRERIPFTKRPNQRRWPILHRRIHHRLHRALATPPRHEFRSTIPSLLQVLLALIQHLSYRQPYRDRNILGVSLWSNCKPIKQCNQRPPPRLKHRLHLLGPVYICHTCSFYPLHLRHFVRLHLHHLHTNILLGWRS